MIVRQVTRVNIKPHILIQMLSLPDTFNPDGKSLYNPPTNVKSQAYDTFPDPIDSSNNGFDFHSKFHSQKIYQLLQSLLQVYYMSSIETELKFARELHQQIRREFPEVICIQPVPIVFDAVELSKLRIYKFWEKPIGWLAIFSKFS